MKRRSMTLTISSLAGMLLLIPAMFCEQHSTYAQAWSPSERARIGVTQPEAQPRGEACLLERIFNVRRSN